MFNTHWLADKTWFNLLLWGGIVATVTMPLFGLGALVGLGIMIAYLAAGPDGMAAQVQQPQTAPPGAVRHCLQRLPAQGEPAPGNRGQLVHPHFDEANLDRIRA